MRTWTRRQRTPHLIVAAVLLTLGATACLPTLPVPVPVPAPSPTPTTSTSTTTTTTALVLAKATCASGSTVTVAASIVDDVQNLLDDAAADRVLLCGGGYRSSDTQIAVRKANCGTTYYDIWLKPASECTPPTAIPGTSMHEKGLAIDFINCSTQTTACFIWLKAHAATYGLINLPSEPWHWSTNGR